LSIYSEQDEIALGSNTDVQIKQQYGIYQDSSLNGYVESVGQSLSAHTHRPNLTYHFAVLDSPVVNAFAVPGGYIYVTRGILTMMNSEAELAVVLGHELGHVNARHSIRRMSEMMLAQIGLVIGSALNKTFADLAGVAGIGIQLLFLKYSRDDERQADQLGVEYARKGYYNPGEMIAFFTSLEKLGDLSGGHSLPGFLSTHPLTSERIQNTKNMLLAGDNSLQTKPEAYLRHIEGTVYGEDPQQGFVEGSAFYHPGMRFLFSFPEGWQVQNTPSKVVIASKDGDAGIIIQAEQSDDTPKVYGQKKADEIKGRQFVEDRESTVNGLSAYQQLCDLEQENSENIRLRLSFIKYASHMFTFMALSTVGKFSEFDSAFGRVVDSFKSLEDKSYLDRQPKRIKLVTADGRRTLQEIFQKAGMDKDLWPNFSIMNGLDLNQRPSKDKLVKIVK
ncbi:MAG: M48 family metalloprotease, partial [Candidatus Aminicenantes bacterium]|nr:M48 family metalloprotease [Candidatus Aminicenantes bacterium]